MLAASVRPEAGTLALEEKRSSLFMGLIRTDEPSSPRARPSWPKGACYSDQRVLIMEVCVLVLDTRAKDTSATVEYFTLLKGSLDTSPTDIRLQDNQCHLVIQSDPDSRDAIAFQP